MLNNPLSYTDPSGYFVDSLFSSAFRILVTAAGCSVGGPIGCGVASSIASLSLGQSVSQSLRNGALAAILPAVFNRIGNLIDDGIGLVAGSLLHGAVGAASAAIQGGDPLAGFVSGTLTKGFTLGTKDFLASINNIAAEVAITSIVGGTISELTGGNFANGAFTAGFGYAFNQSRSLQTIKSVKSTRAQAHSDLESYAQYLQFQVDRGIYTEAEGLALIVEYGAYIYNASFSNIGLPDFAQSFLTIDPGKVLAGLPENISGFTSGTGYVGYGTFIDLGFKAELMDNSNQVRHFIAGFKFGFFFQNLSRAHRFLRPDGPPDELLNDISTDIGRRFSTGKIRIEQLGNTIRQNICGNIVNGECL